MALHWFDDEVTAIGADETTLHTNHGKLAYRKLPKIDTTKGATMRILMNKQLFERYFILLRYEFI